MKKTENSPCDVAQLCCDLLEGQTQAHHALNAPYNTTYLQVKQVSLVMDQQLGSVHKGLHIADDIRTLGEFHPSISVST